MHFTYLRFGIDLMQTISIYSICIVAPPWTESQRGIEHPRSPEPGKTRTGLGAICRWTPLHFELSCSPQDHQRPPAIIHRSRLLPSALHKPQSRILEPRRSDPAT